MHDMQLKSAKVDAAVPERPRDPGRRDACGLVRAGTSPRPVWKSKCYGAFVLDRLAVLPHRCDACSMAWRSRAGPSTSQVGARLRQEMT